MYLQGKTNNTLPGWRKVPNMQNINTTARRLGLRIQRINTERKIKRVEIADLAHAVGVTKWHLTNVLENGANPSEALVIACEATLGIPLTIKRIGE